MEFEWNEEKNRENVSKHGLSFADAPENFDAPVLVSPDKRKDYGEDRWVGIGFLRNFVVVVVYTEREEGVTRIISLRKALKHERARFEQALRDGLGEG